MPTLDEPTSPEGGAGESDKRKENGENNEKEVLGHETKVDKVKERERKRVESEQSGEKMDKEQQETAGGGGEPRRKRQGVTGGDAKMKGNAATTGADLARALEGTGRDEVARADGEEAGAQERGTGGDMEQQGAAKLSWDEMTEEEDKGRLSEDEMEEGEVRDDDFDGEEEGEREEEEEAEAEWRTPGAEHEVPGPLRGFKQRENPTGGPTAYSGSPSNAPFTIRPPEWGENRGATGPDSGVGAAEGVAKAIKEVNQLRKETAEMREDTRQRAAPQTKRGAFFAHLKNQARKVQDTEAGRRAHTEGDGGPSECTAVQLQKYVEGRLRTREEGTQVFTVWNLAHSESVLKMKTGTAGTTDLDNVVRNAETSIPERMLRAGKGQRYENGKTASVYLRGCPKFLTTRLELFKQAFELGTGLMIPNQSDIIVDKTPSSNNHKYDLCSVYVAIVWNEEQVVKLWREGVVMGGTKVRMTSDKQDPDTTMRVMDYMTTTARARGPEFGAWGKGALCETMKALNYAGVPAARVAAWVTHCVLFEFGPGWVEECEHDEMRKFGTDMNGSAVGYQHPSVFWNITLATTHLKTHLQNLQTENRAAFYLHLEGANDDDTFLLAVRLNNMMLPDGNMVALRGGYAMKAAQERVGLPAGAVTGELWFTGEQADIRTALEVQFGMSARTPVTYQTAISHLLQETECRHGFVTGKCAELCGIKKVISPQTDRVRWDRSKLLLEFENEEGRNQFHTLVQEVLSFTLQHGVVVVFHPHVQDPARQWGLGAGRGAGGRGAGGMAPMGRGAGGQERQYGPPQPRAAEDANGRTADMQLQTRWDGMSNRIGGVEGRLERVEGLMIEMTRLLAKIDEGAGRKPEERAGTEARKEADATSDDRMEVANEGAVARSEGVFQPPWNLEEMDASSPPKFPALEDISLPDQLQLRNPDRINVNVGEDLPRDGTKARAAVEYISRLVERLAREVAGRDDNQMETGIWLPSLTYGKQSYPTQCFWSAQLQPPGGTHDIRNWIPPELRTVEVVFQAIKYGIQRGELVQRTRARGLTLCAAKQQ